MNSIFRNDLTDAMCTLAERITYYKFGEEATVYDEEQETMVYTDEAQVFFDEVYDEFDNLYCYWKNKVHR